MRTNGEFIADLRSEIESGQQRRTTFIKLKLTFAVGLLGFGVTDLVSGVEMKALLYLVPFVTLVFDLYIIGADFGIKRTAVFIKTSPAAPSEERLWETDVDQKRDVFAHVAGPFSSILVLIGSGVGILSSNPEIILFGIWIGLSLLAIGFVVCYGFIRKKRITHFEKILMEQNSEREKRCEEGKL